MIFKKLFKNNKGNAATIFLILLLPLFFTMMVLNFEHSRSIQGADIDLQKGLDEAVKAGCYSVSPLSQAYNDPKIEPAKSHETFKYVLAKNLKLDPIYLTPLENSGLSKNPDYIFVVINGKDAEKYGLPSGYLFTSSNPAGIELYNIELPYTIGIDNENLNLGSSEGIYKVEVKKPTCIALIKADLKPIFKGEKGSVRWSAARIIQ